MTSPVYPAAAHFSLASGTRVLNRFTIQRGLGIGGFGEVYFALSDAGKEVALKRIQRNLEIELRGVSHCLNLKHPNLVSLFDVCRDESDHWWIVMEYVAGASLRDCLDAAPAGLGEAETRRWFTAVAAGVAHLHREGLVHRDLKPGNLFDDFGVVKVGDYGLSKYISESRRGGQTESVGTFHYMAPEIGRGEYGREIDLYALGVILYEMLTGRLPFEGETCQEIIIKHLSSEPDLSGVAEPYRSVIDKALRKDPRRRWASASEMIAALGEPAVTLQPASRSASPAAAGGYAASYSSPGGTPRPASPAAEKSPADADRPVRATLVGDPPQRTQLHPAAASLPAVAIAGPSREPLAQALGVCWQNLRRWWHEVQLSPVARLLVIALIAFVLVRNLRWLLPLLSVIGFIYVPYYVVRQLLLARRRSLCVAESGAVSAARVDRAVDHAVPPPRRAVRLTRANWRQIKRAELANKRASTQLAELTGSWAAAAIAAVFCGTAAGVIGLRQVDATPTLLAPYGSMVVVAFAIAVVVLGLGKLWEGRDGDPLNRRLVLAGTGGVLGALAYAVGGYLMIPLESAAARSIDVTGLPLALYHSDATPRLSALMAHFAILIAGVRWWKLTDPVRSRRLSLWAVAVVVVAEWLIHQFVPIPQPWGMLVAGSAVIAVQIGAAWESPEGLRHHLKA